MAKSKARAKSNKKQKQKEDSDREELAANEYFVGMLFNATPARTRPDAQRVSRESHQSKGQCYPERHGLLGERAFTLPSVFPTA